MARNGQRQDNPLVIVGGVVFLLVAALGMVKAMRSPAPPPRISTAPASHAEEVPEREDFAPRRAAPEPVRVVEAAPSPEPPRAAPVTSSRDPGPGDAARLSAEDEEMAQRHCDESMRSMMLANGSPLSPEQYGEFRTGRLPLSRLEIAGGRRLMVRAKELEAAGRIPAGSARAACEGAIRQAPPSFYADLDADMIEQILERWAVALR